MTVSIGSMKSIRVIGGMVTAMSNAVPAKATVDLMGSAMPKVRGGPEWAKQHGGLESGGDYMKGRKKRKKRR